MLKRLIVVGILLALPGAAHAQLQLHPLQQQQVWRLQQQERQARAHQDARLQEQLLQQQVDAPPLPDPERNQPPDDVGRRALSARLQAEQLELMRQQRQQWQNAQEAQQEAPQDRMRDLQQNQQFQLQQQQQQLQLMQQQQQQQLLQRHLMQQQQQLNQLQQQPPGPGR